MQANKADQAVMRDLKEWLENPKTSAGAGITEGSREDLAWLEKSKDLSSVNLGNPKKASSMSQPGSESAESRLWRHRQLVQSAVLGSGNDEYLELCPWTTRIGDVILEVGK